MEIIQELEAKKKEFLDMAYSLPYKHQQKARNEFYEKAQAIQDRIFELESEGNTTNTTNGKLPIADVSNSVCAKCCPDIDNKGTDEECKGCIEYEGAN